MTLFKRLQISVCLVTAGVAIPSFALGDEPVDLRRRSIWEQAYDSSADASPEPSKNPVLKQPEADWSVHLQNTDIFQGVPGFHDPYNGPQSLRDDQVRETISLTGFITRRLWQGASISLDPEFFQGIGLSHTFGAAGFPNGEAQKGGEVGGDLYIARVYVRQVIGFGGEAEPVAEGPNQLEGPQDISRLSIQFGKFAANDILDDNTFSHDTRTQFLNWSLWESAAWDFPADVKGYTYGIFFEFNQKNWALRYQRMEIPRVQNGVALHNEVWRRFGDALEWETRYQLWGQPGKLRLLGFVNRDDAAKYSEVLANPALMGNPLPLRATNYKYGGVINVEQELASGLGAFLRLSTNDGKTESWSFTDVDRSAALGLSLKGAQWARPEDTVGLAGVINGLSVEHREFLAASGFGVTVGDGRLNYEPEEIVELYYDARLVKWTQLTANLAFDYQLLNHPAYNADRGPANVMGVRLHVAY